MANHSARARPGISWPVVVLLALLTGPVAAACTGGTPARQLPGTNATAAITATATATATGSGQAPAQLAGEPVPPVQSASPPMGPAGLLAASAPVGESGSAFQVWFGGVPIGREGGQLVIGYPSVMASSDGRRTVAHAKVAVFRCARLSADGSPNYAGCRRRAVEYGDLSAPAARLVRGPDGGLTLVGRFPTYTYGTAVDRNPQIMPRWTGRAYLIRVDLQPAAGQPGAVIATVTLGAGSAAVSAGLDTGYPNRLRAPGPDGIRRTAASVPAPVLAPTSTARGEQAPAAPGPRPGRAVPA